LESGGGWMPVLDRMTGILTMWDERHRIVDAPSEISAASASFRSSSEKSLALLADYIGSDNPVALTIRI